MPSLHNQQGNFKIELNQPDFEKRLIEASVALSLDDSSQCVVDVAADSTFLASVKAADLPQSASVHWQGKGLFKGHLLSLDTSAPAKLRLVYQDALFKSKKKTANAFSKKGTLEASLRKLLSDVGLPSRFSGIFSETLPSYTGTGETLFQLLTSLSQQYGFHFVCKSVANHVAFLKLGQSFQSVEIDLKEKALAVSHTSSASAQLSTVHVSHFDSRRIQKEEHELSSALYEPIQVFTQHPLFREKQSWTLGEGSVETFVHDPQAFEQSEKRLASQCSKGVLGQEALIFRTFEPLAVPGDRIQVSHGTCRTLWDGAYLVQRVLVQMQSALPKMEITAVRA